MEKALQHKKAPQCIGLQAASPGNHHTSGSEANDALTIKLDQLNEAALYFANVRSLQFSPGLTILASFSGDGSDEDCPSSGIMEQLTA